MEQQEIPRLLTRQEAADLLHVSLPTLWTYDRKGILTPKRIGRRVLYTLDDIYDVLQKDNEPQQNQLQ